SEASEYRLVTRVLLRPASSFALAMEFHEVDDRPELFNSLIDKIKRDFYIVNIHGNNLGGLAPFHFPISPEITFLNGRFFQQAPSPSALKYPVPELDRPNHPGFPEFKFEF